MHHVQIFQYKISCVKQKYVRFPVCVFFLNRFFIAAGYILRVQGPYPMPAICKEFNNTKQQIYTFPSPFPPLSPFPLFHFFPYRGKKLSPSFVLELLDGKLCCGADPFWPAPAPFWPAPAPFFYVPPAPTHGSKFLSLISLKKLYLGLLKVSATRIRRVPKLFGICCANIWKSST